MSDIVTGYSKRELLDAVIHERRVVDVLARELALAVSGEMLQCTAAPDGFGNVGGYSPEGMRAWAEREVTGA